MSSLRYETAKLCEQIRRIGSIPSSGSTFTDADLTAIMNMELQSAVVPVIQAVREEYFVVVEDFTFAAGVSTIDIMPEAIGMRIRDIALKEADGHLIYLPRISPEMYDIGSGYTIRNNQVVLSTPYTTDVTISVKYYKRPNDLTTDTVKIVSKGSGTTVTVDNIPADWGTIASAITVDTISAIVPFIGKKYNVAATITGVDTLTLTAEAFALVSVGDYIALEGTSPVPQYIPVEAHHLMVQGANTRCLEAMGDKDGYKMAANKYNGMEKALVSIINPRVESQSKKVVTNRTLHSLLSGR